MSAESDANQQPRSTDHSESAKPKSTSTSASNPAPRSNAPGSREARAGSSGPGAAEAPSTKPSSKPLTKEEQMALYEEDLKENDWGHQPC